MIKLVKKGEPQILADHSVEWTEAVLELDGEEATSYQKNKYNNPEIKTVLVSETDGKCAYCESKVLHIDFGDIEHILPKSERPDLWFSWGNLTLACSVCNNKKRAYHDEELPLLDPYNDEPEVRLLFFGPFARPVPGDASAKMTEVVLELNRPKLLERRTERMDNLLALAAVLSQAPAALRNLLIADFVKETNPDREYASLARTVARQLGI